MSAFSGAFARRGGGALCLLLMLLLLQQASRVAAAGEPIDSPAVLAQAEVSAAEQEPAAAAAAAAAEEEPLSVITPEPTAAQDGGEGAGGAATPTRNRYVSWLWGERPAAYEEPESKLHRFGLGFTFGRATPEELQRMQSPPMVKRVSRKEGIRLVLWAMLLYVVAVGLRQRGYVRDRGVLGLMESGAAMLALLGFLHVAFFSYVKKGLKIDPLAASYPGETKKEALLRRVGLVFRSMVAACASLLTLALTIIFIALLTMLLSAGVARGADILAGGVTGIVNSVSGGSQAAAAAAAASAAP
ncbi:hypothetical protein ACSSS7_000204 [Eimeria intestinalis]